MLNRLLGGFAFVAVLIPAVASAQFTTFIAPVKKAKDSVKAVAVAQQKVVKDSVTRAQIADMKTWVDSAAGLVVPTAPAADSMRPTAPPTAVVVPAPSPPSDVTVLPAVPNGVRAPATASSLPLFVLFGCLGLASGVMLLRWPDQKLQKVVRGVQ